MLRSRIRVLVVDDHGVVRAGVRSLLRLQRDIDVVGEAEDPAGALAQVQALSPHVVTLDLSTPNSIAAEVVRRMLDVVPRANVLAFTTHEEAFYVQAMMDAGARGYLSKRASEQLAAAIRVVHHGDRFLCHIATAAMEEARRSNITPDETTGPSMWRAVASLSRRERAVLGLLAQGYTYQDIAQQLGIGVNSVGTYRSRLAQKLGVRGRQDLVRVGLASGVIQGASRPSSRHPRSGGAPDGGVS